MINDEMMRVLLFKTNKTAKSRSCIKQDKTSSLQRFWNETEKNDIRNDLSTLKVDKIYFY